jgi:hypothetical protein
MLIRKDDTVLERRINPSTRSADIGDPFAIKFIGKNFQVIFPYHTLLRARIEDDILKVSFPEGVSIECEGSNLTAILDSIWTARLQLVEESPDYLGKNRLLPEGEVVVENMRYCEAAEELT